MSKARHAFAGFGRITDLKQAFGHETSGNAGSPRCGYSRCLYFF